MPFRPKPADIIVLNSATYTFTEHPAALGMAYGQAGRRGTVYQLSDENGQLWALKAFLPQYAEPRLVGLAERIRAYAGLPGLRAAEREVLTASRYRDLIREHMDLAYAVLMPWVAGRTWQEIVVGREIIPEEELLKAVQHLVGTLVGLEERGLAHCDLSGPNVILTPEAGIELVDLEEMYGPELVRPQALPGGSPGYAHKTAPEGLWRAEADRFAGAVLLGEILGWADGRIREEAWGEGYFQPEEMGESSERLRLLKDVLRGWNPALEGLLDAAWYADSLAGCPTFTHWLAALPDRLAALPDRLQGTGSPSRAEGGKPERAVGEDPGVLAMDAEELVQAGRMADALDMLRRAEELAQGAFRARIVRRREELQAEKAAGSLDPVSTRAAQEHTEAEVLVGTNRDERAGREHSAGAGLPAGGSASWTCPVCGHAAGAGDAVCTFCEKGERPDGAVSPDPGKTTGKKEDVRSGIQPGHLGPRKKAVGGVKRRVKAILIWIIVLAAGTGLLWGLSRTGVVRRMLGQLKPVPAGTELNSLVHVSAGSFLMGSRKDDPGAQDDEFPQQEVTLDEYWIERTEVTNAQFGAFLNEMGNQEEGRANWLDADSSYSRLEEVGGEWYIEQGYEDHPVVEVTWYGASAYCEWAGGRLPTEAEWEKAARGTDGRIYPWGDEAPTCRLAQYDACDGRTIPVGSLPDGASPYGALDMAGNVWEWVADRYDSDYYDRSPDTNPTGPETGDGRVLRGGSWNDYPTFLRAANRNGHYPDDTRYYFGFRCVRSP